MSRALFRNTFLLVGGIGTESYLSTVLEYDPETEGWITWQEEISKARYDVAGMMLDSAMFPDCE
jgi:hypothetical protein